MANALAGTLYVTVDGVSTSCVGEGEWRLSDETREVMMGADGFHGYKAKPQYGLMKFKGRYSPAVSISTLNGAVNATVVFALINGQSVIGSGMFRNGDPISVTTEEADFDIEFAGPTVTVQ
jgi:hypothetical protein